MKNKIIAMPKEATTHDMARTEVNPTLPNVDIRIPKSSSILDQAIAHKHNNSKQVQTSVTKEIKVLMTKTVQSIKSGNIRILEASKGYGKAELMDGTIVEVYKGKKDGEYAVKAYLSDYSKGIALPVYSEEARFQAYRLLNTILFAKNSEGVKICDVNHLRDLAIANEAATYGLFESPEYTGPVIIYPNGKIFPKYIQWNKPNGLTLPAGATPMPKKLTSVPDDINLITSDRNIGPTTPSQRIHALWQGLSVAEYRWIETRRIAFDANSTPEAQGFVSQRIEEVVNKLKKEKFTLTKGEGYTDLHFEDDITVTIKDSNLPKEYLTQYDPRKMVVIQRNEASLSLPLHSEKTFLDADRLVHLAKMYIDEEIRRTSSGLF